MTDLLLIGGPNAGRHLYSHHDIQPKVYTMTAEGPCCYQHASTVSRDDGEIIELYVCEDLPKSECRRLLAEVAALLSSKRSSSSIRQ